MHHLQKFGSFAALALVFSACDTMTVQGTLGVNRGLSINTGKNVAQLPAGQYPVSAKLKNRSLEIMSPNGFAFKLKNVRKARDARGQEIFISDAGSNGQNFSLSGSVETRSETSEGGTSSESCVLGSREVYVCDTVRRDNLPRPSLYAQISQLLVTSAFAREHDGGGHDRGGGSRDHDSRGNHHDHDRGRDNDHRGGTHRDNDRGRDNDHRGGNRRDNDRRRDNDHRRDDRDDRRSDRGGRRDHDRDHDRDRNRDHDHHWNHGRDLPRCRYVTESDYGSRMVRVSTVTTYARVRAVISQSNAQAATFNSQWTVKDTSRQTTPISSCH